MPGWSLRRGALPLSVIAVAGLLSAGAAPAAADHPPGTVSPYSWACDGSAPEDGFVDVPPDNVHEAAIDCAVARGLAAGTGGSTYVPAGVVTRAQMATFVVRLLSANGTYLPDPDAGGDPFDDDDGSPHETAINKLAVAGIARGVGDRVYGPDGPVTRGQMATYLARAYERVRLLELPQARGAFADDDGSPHEQSIDQVAGMGVTGGAAPGRYAPDTIVRRDQIARFLASMHGCLRDWPRDGTHHAPLCDRYTDTDGASALEGFSVDVSVPGGTHAAGADVPVDVRACNLRTTELRQVFPQRDWFALEVRHEQYPRGGPEADLQWYDHRWGLTLNRGGYEPRDHFAVHRRIGAAHPQTSALTWYDGPQTTPDEVVTWAPGECKALDVGAWMQTDKAHLASPDIDEYPRQWRTYIGSLQRATPGWQSMRLHWGGVEVGQARRYLTADSGRFHLDGPRLTATVPARAYAPDEPVVITVSACNDGGQPYAELVGAQDTTGDGEVLVLHVRGNASGRGPVGTVTVPEGERGLTWAAGECKTWDLTWDQRSGGRAALPNERFDAEVDWNTRNEGRAQDASGAFTLEGP